GRNRPGAGGNRRGARRGRATLRLSPPPPNGFRASEWVLERRAGARTVIRKGRSHDMSMAGAAARSGHNVTPEFLAERARFVRLETVRLTRIAGAGHYSSTFSAAELFAALYYAHLRIDPARPDWPDRDRFILSKGHAAIGLYPVLADLGFFDP